MSTKKETDFDNYPVDSTGKLCYNKIAQIKKKQGGLKLKKRILTMLLSALLVANISACSYVPENNIQGEILTSENSSAENLYVDGIQNEKQQKEDDVSTFESFSNIKNTLNT